MEKKKTTNAKKATTKKVVKKETAKKQVKNTKESKKPVAKEKIKDVVLEERLKKQKKQGFKTWFTNLSLNQTIIGCTIVILILLIVLIAVSVRNTKLKNGDEIVVKVNGKTVTAEELYTKLKATNGRSVAIDQIDDYIINKEYKTTDAMRTQAETSMKNYKSQYGTQYNSMLSYYGVSTDAEFKELLIKQTKLSKITDDYIKANLTEREKKAYYESNIVGDIRASHILISFNYASDATDDEKTKAEAAAKTKAEEVITKLKNGGDFAKLAKEYSDDSGTKSNGGDLGYFNKGQMESAFETAVYALDLNEYTKEPVKTSYGYHIIMKTGQKDKPSYKDSKEKIVEGLVTEKESDTTLYYKAMAALRKKYKMVIKDKTIKSDYDAYNQKNFTTTTTTTTTTSSN